MITPLSITSLNQGKDLARWHVEKLYAEPAEPAPPVALEAAASTEAATPEPRVLHGWRQSLVARFVALWDAALPIGIWRL